MPITTRRSLRPMSQDDFRKRSYDLVGILFGIRNKLGRLFDEQTYKRALAAHTQGLLLEEPITLTFRDFTKTLYIDALIDDGAILEFKATESLAPRHQAQLLQYLMLTNLCHGLLVNVRTEEVERRFVNSTMSYSDRTAFQIDDTRYDNSMEVAAFVQTTLVELLRDWGTALEIPLYVEVLTHCLGGEERVERDVPVMLDSLALGHQRMRLAADRVAFRVTAFEDSLIQEKFESHATRLLSHVELDSMLWVNIARHLVTFRTLKQE